MELLTRLISYFLLVYPLLLLLACVFTVWLADYRKTVVTVLRQKLPLAMLTFLLFSFVQFYAMTTWAFFCDVTKTSFTDTHFYYLHRRSLFAPFCANVGVQGFGQPPLGYMKVNMHFTGNPSEPTRIVPYYFIPLAALYAIPLTIVSIALLHLSKILPTYKTASPQ